MKKDYKAGDTIILNNGSSFLISSCKVFYDELHLNVKGYYKHKDQNHKDHYVYAIYLKEIKEHISQKSKIYELW